MNQANTLLLQYAFVLIIICIPKSILVAGIMQQGEHQRNAVRTIQPRFLEIANSRADSTIKESKTSKVRKQTKDSLRRRYKETLIQESWSVFRRYAEANLDTTSILPIQHPFAQPAVRRTLLDTIIPWIGTRYGSTISKQERSLDCSLFTAIIMRHVLGIQLLHGSSSIAGQVRRIRSIKSILFGDLVFFTGSNPSSKRVGHVGMYIANGVFAHASIQKGVIFSHWHEPYYAKRFLFAGTVRLD